MRADAFLDDTPQSEPTPAKPSAAAFLDAESFLESDAPEAGLQNVGSEPVPSFNMARGAVERGGQLLGGLFEAGNALAEQGEESYPLGGLVWQDGLIPDYKGPEEYAQWRAEQGGDEPLKIAADHWNNTDAGYEENHTWERVKQEFSEGGALSGSAWAEVMAYGAEQGVKSIPDMVAAVVALPSYITARSGEIGAERAKNKGKAETELVDVLEAAPAAIGSALLERLGAKGITEAGAEALGKEALKHGFGKMAKEGAKAGGKEAGTEFLQEGIIEYLGEKLGTGADMSWAEAGERGVAGAVAGGVYGTGAGTVQAGINQVRNQGLQTPPESAPPVLQDQVQDVPNPVQDQDVPVLQPTDDNAPVNDYEGRPEWANERTNIFRDGVEPEAEPEAEQVTPDPTPQRRATDGQPQSAEDFLTESGTGVFRVPVDRIKVDPQQYQFRSRVNEQGVDKRLDGVKQWDDDRAGFVMLHKRMNGDLYVADGHHRVDLARKLNQGEINARVVDEADGDSVADVRVKAAMANIADGKAEPLDVAKVFRDSEVPLDQVRARYDLPNNQVSRDGEALAKLSDNVFGMVASGQLSEKDGAAIGNAFDDAQQQETAVKAFQNLKPSKDYERELVLNEVRAAEFAENQGEQSGLFGDDPQEISLMQERMKVLDSLRQQLNADKRLFKSLNSNADRASTAGNKIAKQANAEITERSARSLDLIGRVTTTPDLNAMVNRAAKRVYDGKSRSTVAKELKQELLSYERGSTEQSSGRPAAPSGQRAPVETGQDVAGNQPVPETDPVGTDQAGQSEGQQGEVTPGKDSPRGLTDLSDSEYKEIVDAARYLKDFAYSTEAITDGNKRAMIRLSKEFGKSGRDTLLMNAFNIDRNTAHTVNNNLDASTPHSLRKQDMEDAFAMFPGLREIVDTALDRRSTGEVAGEVTEEATPALELEAQTEADLAEQSAAKEAAEQAEAEQRKAEEQKATADEQVNGFALTGSNRTADVAMAAGQDDMFVATPASRKAEAEAKPAREEVAAKESAEPQAQIDDFGEKLEGARKDIISAYKDKLDFAGELDTAAVPLSKSWPEPNYQKMLDEGVAADTVALIRALRDEVPTKPQKSWKLKGWVEMVNGLRDMAGTLMEDNAVADKVIELMKSNIANNRLARESKQVIGRMELYQEFGHADSFKGVTFGAAFYQIYNGEKNVTIWEVERQSKATSFGNMPRTLATGKTREEALANLRKALDKLPESTKSGTAVRFNIYRDRYSNDVFIGKKVGKDVLRLKTFDDDVKAAREYLANNQEALEAQLAKMKEIPSHRRQSNSPRVGVDHRKGGDVTPEAFAETFGFRGVQFGNYVEQGRRQADLNQAYDALMDLAGILDIPAKAISLNGELGLAFGARGKGGKNSFAAHYEPGQIVINLTKKSGAGSLAHEWWHSLDNYFGRERGARSNDRFATDNRPAESVRPAVIDAFRHIRSTVNSMKLKERSKALDKVRTKAYWSTTIEMTARSFESYVIERLKDQQASNDYLANIVSEDYWKAAEALGMEDGNTYPYPEAAEIPQIRAAYDHFFNVVDTQETEDGNVALFSRTGETPRFSLNDPRFMFAGPQSETSDLSALEQARNMEQAGRPAPLIFKETGWTRGADGLWRYEIDDSQAKLKDVSLSGEAQLYTLEQLLDHPALFEAYPNLEETTVVLDPTMEDGHNGTFRWGVGIDLNAKNSNEQILSTLLHEIQHAIQSAEGFARGGSSDREFTNSIKMAVNENSAMWERRLSQWYDRNQDLVRDADNKSDLATYALMYQSAKRLMSYANSDRPSGVLRNIKNEMGWVYSDKVRQDEDLRRRFDELERNWYNLPKRHKMRERNAFLREQAGTAAQLIREVIPRNVIREFDADTRQLPSMIKALERSAEKAYKALKPARDLQKKALRAHNIGEKYRFEGPFSVYRALAGEIEARNTQARQSMSAEERRQTPPARTADVPNDEAIVVMRTSDGEVIEVPYSESREGYLRTPDQSRQGLSRTDAQAHVDTLMAGWKGAPKVTVARRIQEFPEGLRLAVIMAQAENDMRAVYWNNAVYVLAPRIPNTQVLEEVILHEVIGHYGLRKLLGSDLRPVLHQVYLKLGKTKQAQQLKQTYFPGGTFDSSNTNHRLTVAEELIAHIAETREHQTLWAKVVAAIRNGLRRLGFTLELTKADVLSLLRGAQRVVEQGGYEMGSEVALAFRRAFHGTPHRFDQFSLAAMGTGEGAQAYGWGLYFAANRNVAEYYRESLSASTAPTKKLMIGGAEIPNGAYKPFDYLRKNGGDLNDAIAEFESRLQAAQREAKEFSDILTNPDEYVSEAQEYVDFLNQLENTGQKIEVVESPRGNLYEVEIPDDSDLLDWDAPLSEQPDAVRAALKATGHITNGGKGFRWLSNPTGRDIYELLAAQEMLRGSPYDTMDEIKGAYEDGEGDHQSASDYLNSLGIPGLRYLDGSSRTQGDGHHNYVIWDEKVIDVQAVNDQQAQADALFSRQDPTNPDIRFSRAPDLDETIPTLEPEAENAYDRAFKSLGNKDKTIFTKAKNLLRRELTPGGLLPQSVFKAKLDRDFKLNGLEFDIANRLGHFDTAVKEAYRTSFDKLDPSEIEKINHALGGDQVFLTLPEPMRIELHKMRLVIKNLSRQYARHLATEIQQLQAQGSDAAAAAKAQLLQTIINNLDTYVHRSYRAFDDPTWPRKVTREVYDSAARYLEQRYREQSGMSRAQIQDRVSKTLELILEEGTAFDGIESFIKESKLGAKDLSVLQRRKQIAPEIRALLGEYTDPKVNFTKSVTKMARLVMNQKFLDKVREIGLAEGFLFEEADRQLDATRRIAADASEVYAPLNGLYTFPEIDQAFKDALGKEQMADWFRTIVRLNGMVKYGKTVLSPTTAARNWMSASFFAMANGHFDFTQMTKSVASIREYFTHGGGRDGYLRKMKRLGVIYDTPYAGEMMDLLADSQLESSLFNKKPFTNLRRANEIAQKFYQYGDDFWKIIGFENEKALLMKHKGLTSEQAEVEAAERIRNTYPTYSMTGRFVQRLRRFPLAGTFVSFPAEIVRTSYHILRYVGLDLQQTPSLGYRKVAGLAIAAGMIHALQSVAMAMVGMDDDEEEAFRDLAAPWMKNSNLLPLGRNEKGQIRLIDMSFLDPYNYFKRPINAMLRDQPLDDAIKSAAVDLWSPFFGQDIAFGAISEALNNKKESGGRVFNPHAPVVDQSLDIANHMRKALQPGIAANVERIVKASSGEISASGRPYSLKDEAAALVGFRITTFDPKASIYYKAFEFQDKKRDATSILSSVAKNPNEVSDSALRDAYFTAEKTRTEAYEDMIQLVNAGMSAGLTRWEIAVSLRNSGVSKQDTQYLLNGRVPPWRPSNSMMRGAIKKARVLFDGDVAKEFDRRRLLIQQTFRESLKK